MQIVEKLVAYDWFDNLDKLQHPSLPEYPAWYFKLKGQYSLSLKEWQSCKRIFRERGITTFADWLRYYNDLDVEQFLEALTNMRNFYHRYGVDILKDVVSLLRVSLQFLYFEAPTNIVSVKIRTVQPLSLKRVTRFQK